ncbi:MULTISPECIES: hypothetical protein [unclassified Saccharopolyspora]|uniref:hypothetical protein n=1 Tax=Saccharopolyspora TaxID=1835 RepID=UPI00190B5F27|nr:hypothetical protein [Saccharopolyspora sp. HNM0986]MBK0869227.1 hypothetical protein [Saccharopolyspora sp. HNM0986]
MDALQETVAGARAALAQRARGGAALGTAPGGRDRAKGYFRAMLDCVVWLLTERAGTARPVSYALARRVIAGEITPEEALALHAGEPVDAGE